jgi:hypothetical protein
MSASTATAAGSGTFFRSAAAAGFIAFAFDPDDRKDQDGRHAFAWSATHGWAQPSRNRIRRKFDDGGHIKLSLVDAPTKLGRRQAIIKNRTWLTAS